MKTIKLIVDYLIRIVKSAPFLGAGLLDVVLLILNSLGLEYHLPTWFYGLFLGIGYAIENIRIYIEYRTNQA